jgi:hypothetical protein
LAPPPAELRIGCAGVPHAQSELVPPAVQAGALSKPSVYGKVEIKEPHCDQVRYDWVTKQKLVYNIFLLF